MWLLNTFGSRISARAGCPKVHAADSMAVQKNARRDSVLCIVVAVCSRDIFRSTSRRQELGVAIPMHSAICNGQSGSSRLWKLSGTAMLEAILEMVLDLVFTCFGPLVLGFIWWVVLLPALWVLSSPVVVILAIFTADPYWSSVRELFSTLTNLWNHWGLRFLP